MQLLFETQDIALIDRIMASMLCLLKNNIMQLLSTQKEDEQIYKKIKNIIITIISEKYLKTNQKSGIFRKNIAQSLTIII